MSVTEVGLWSILAGCVIIACVLAYGYIMDCIRDAEMETADEIIAACNARERAYRNRPPYRSSDYRNAR